MKTTDTSFYFQRSANIYRWLSSLLRFGMLLSLCLVGLGMFLLAIKGREIERQAIYPGHIVNQPLKLQPETILNWGILVLLATPISVVISLIILFWKQKERFYALVSAAVLCVLLISILLAQHLL